MSTHKTLLKLTVSRASSLSKIFWVWSSGNLSTVVITFAMVYEKNEHRSTIGRSLLPRDTVCWGGVSVLAMEATHKEVWCEGVCKEIPAHASQSLGFYQEDTFTMARSSMKVLMPLALCLMNMTHGYSFLWKDSLLHNLSSDVLPKHVL